MRATPSLLSAAVHLQIEVEALAEVRVLARDLRLCERASRNDAAPAAVPERVREAVRRLKAAIPGAREAQSTFRRRTYTRTGQAGTPKWRWVTKGDVGGR